MEMIKFDINFHIQNQSVQFWPEIFKPYVKIIKIKHVHLPRKIMFNIFGPLWGDLKCIQNSNPE